LLVVIKPLVTAGGFFITKNKTSLNQNFYRLFNQLSRLILF